MQTPFDVNTSKKICETLNDNGYNSGPDQVVMLSTFLAVSYKLLDKSRDEFLKNMSDIFDSIEIKKDNNLQ